MPQRSGPLTLSAGSLEATLLAAEANRLLDGLQKLAEGMRNSHTRSTASSGESLQKHLAELEALGDALASASGSFTDPPLRISHDQARLLRTTLSDMTGYQREQLTPGLDHLRKILSVDESGR